MDILSVPKISNTKKNAQFTSAFKSSRCPQFAAKERARLRAFLKKEQLRWQAGHFVSLDYPQFTASTKISNACGAHLLLFFLGPGCGAIADERLCERPGRNIEVFTLGIEHPSLLHSPLLTLA